MCLVPYAAEYKSTLTTEILLSSYTNWKCLNIIQAHSHREQQYYVKKLNYFISTFLFYTLKHSETTDGKTVSQIVGWYKSRSAHLHQNAWKKRKFVTFVKTKIWILNETRLLQLKKIVLMGTLSISPLFTQIQALCLDINKINVLPTRNSLSLLTTCDNLLFNRNTRIVLHLVTVVETLNILKAYVRSFVLKSIHNTSG